MVDARTEAILEWRSAMSALPDSVFLDLMRMYLGDIKTPFNKQSLLEQLGAFLRRPEHIDVLCSYLNSDDRLILTAISLLHPAFITGIQDVVSGCLSPVKVVDVVQSLEERLVLCRVMRDGRYELIVNPYISDSIAEITDPTLLFPSTSEASFLHDATTSFVDDLLLAGVFSVFRSGLDIMKIDGAIKKKTQELLVSVLPTLFALQPHCAGFPELHDAFSVLFSGLQNLQLLQSGDNGVVARIDNWNVFAALSLKDRLLYIAAASDGRKPRSLLEENALLLNRFIMSFPADGCSPSEALRLFYLVYGSFSAPSSSMHHKNGSTRLSRLLDTGVPVDSNTNETRSPRLYLLSAAVSLGMLCVLDGRIYANSSFVLQEQQKTQDSTLGYVTVDSAGMITIFPGLPLASLLGVMSFLDVESVQTAGTFSLTKASALKAFASGMTADDILTSLSNLTAVPIPQNLSFLVHDWYSGYSQNTLYCGYVLSVESERRTLIENSAELAPYIAKTLAPGVYLLSVAITHSAVADQHSVITALRTAGVDVACAVVPGLPQNETSLITPFMPIKTIDPYELPKRNKECRQLSHDVPYSESQITERIDTLNVTREQRDALLSLVQRRVILSLDQLCPGAVRFERTEARGVDFLGKVHLAETAIIDGSLLEVTYAEDGETKTVCGYPAPYQKKQADVLIRLYSEESSASDDALVVVSLARAKVVRKRRRSLFASFRFGE